jgi:uncharacterized repeat protein (TIGR02543 family)
MPASGYLFAGWQGDASGATNPISVKMDSNKTVTATFAPVAPNQYTLTAAASPSDVGTLIRDPDQPQYPAGVTVTVTATPAAGYQFTGWQGDASGSTNPVTVKMDGNKTVTATFVPVAPNQYTLTVSASPADGGTITRAPDQPQYSSGATVTVTATAASGYQFTGWQGDAGGSTNPITITINANKAITAMFVRSSSTSFFNDTQDSMSIVSLKIDGVERLRPGEEVLPQRALDVSVLPGGHSYETAHGYVDASGRHDLYTRSGSYTQIVGTQRVTVPGRTLMDLLTPYEWKGMCGDLSQEPIIEYEVTFRFYRAPDRAVGYRDGLAWLSVPIEYQGQDPSQRVVNFVMRIDFRDVHSAQLFVLGDYFTVWCNGDSAYAFRRSAKAPSQGPGTRRSP